MEMEIIISLISCHDKVSIFYIRHSDINKASLMAHGFALYQQSRYSYIQNIVFAVNQQKPENLQTCALLSP